MQKEFKTFQVGLLSGKKKRLAKGDVCCVELQMRIDGKFDVVVFMNGGSSFIVADSKSEIERKIGGRNERRNTDNEGLPTARPHE